MKKITKKNQQPNKPTIYFMSLNFLLFLAAMTCEQFHQDDAHIFCSPDQMESEVARSFLPLRLGRGKPSLFLTPPFVSWKIFACLAFIDRIYKAFGLSKHRIRTPFRTFLFPF